MKKLLSLPPNLVHCFHELEGVDTSEWFCTSDPIGAKLGSGGGTTWLLQACHENIYSILTKQHSNNVKLLFNMIKKDYPKEWHFMLLS